MGLSAPNQCNTEHLLSGRRGPGRRLDDRGRTGIRPAAFPVCLPCHGPRSRHGSFRSPELAILERMNAENRKKIKLAAPPRPGIYPHGSETVDAILEAALHILIEEGASAFTISRIAAKCGMKKGNVSRHFPRKEMLVQVLLDEFLSPDETEVERGLREAGLSAEQALAIIIDGNMEAIRTKKMTRLFIELWAMANHNKFVAERVELAYDYVHKLIGTFVAELNPALAPRDVEVVAIYISATMEGATMLAGYGKPWRAMMPQIKAIAVKNLIELVKTITPEDVQGLPPKPEKRAGRAAIKGAAGIRK